LITSQTAGGEHAATGPDHGVQSLTFAAEGAGHRLVEQVQPVGHLALDDQRQPEIGERHQFQITIADPAGEVQGLGQQGSLPLRLVAGVALHQLQPPVESVITARPDRPAGSGDPAPRGHRVVQV
jgi:hypothetical protein